MFIGKMFESLLPRIEDLEKRQLQKGDKGEKGDQGIKGKDGRDGADGYNGRDGINGKDGRDGKDGKKGKDGISVVDAEIAADDHLVFKLSNDKIIDAGELPKANKNSGVFVSGNSWQITVSSTPPSNPYINQLWLDIS